MEKQQYLEIRYKIEDLYHKILLRDADKEGLDYFCNKVVNDNLSITEIQNILEDSPEFKDLQMKKKELAITCFEQKIYSQHGEDGILNFIFSSIGTTNKFCVEIGCGDGQECNMRFFLENGWKGILIDNVASLNCKFKEKFPTGNNEIVEKKIRIPETIKNYFKDEFVTIDNINNIFLKYKISCYVDLLSIDIDYNTFWLWDAIIAIKPRVVVIEYNSQFPPTESKVVKYFPHAGWDWTNYYGASLLALVKLGYKKGYDLVGCDSSGVNAFFILHSEIEKNEIKLKKIEELYRSPQFGDVWDGKAMGWPISNKIMDDY